MSFFFGMIVGGTISFVLYAMILAGDKADKASEEAYDEYINALIREDKFKKEVQQQMDEIYRRRDDSNRMAGETEATEADDSGRIKQTGDPTKQS